MAGHKGHVVEVCDVPGGDYVPSGVWVVFEKFYGLCDLVDGCAIVVFPGSPLG